MSPFLCVASYVTVDKLVKGGTFLRECVDFFLNNKKENRDLLLPVTTLRGSWSAESFQV